MVIPLRRWQTDGKRRAKSTLVGVSDFSPPENFAETTGFAAGFDDMSAIGRERRQGEQTTLSWAFG
jgi:hypothetical protein